MKYLSLFENYTKELDIPEHIKQVVIDLSYEIVDDGYIVTWSNDGHCPTINITKGKYAQEASYYSDIKYFCDRVVDYLDSQGYQGLIKFKYLDTSLHTDVYYPIERCLANSLDLGLDSYMLCYSRYYKIEVYKKEDINESYKLFESEEIDFISDLFLEVKDMGFDVDIDSKSGKIDISVKKGLTDSELASELVNMGSFRLSLIKDTLLTVISYLEKSGYDLESIFLHGGDFSIDDNGYGEIMELDDFEDLTGDAFLSASILSFTKHKDYDWLNEVNHYLNLPKVIDFLNDICYELKDEGLEYQIEPDNEIKVRMLSQVLNDKIEPTKLDFSLKIDTTGKLTDKVKRSGMFSAPNWFMEILRRIFDYMTSLGFSVKYSVNHPYGWRQLSSIDELSEISGIVRAVKLNFYPNSSHREVTLSSYDDSDKLYHATYKYNLPSIKRKGLDTRDVDSVWSDSKKGVIYLSDDPFVAESYAEVAEDVDDEIYDSGIVILEIDLDDLDLSKLKRDKNDRSDGPSRTYEYHGEIPFSAIRIFNQNEYCKYLN